MILTEKSGRQSDGYLLRDILIANNFPFKISKAFFTGSLFGEENVTSMTLQDFFKHYVSKSEANVIEGLGSVIV